MAFFLCWLLIDEYFSERPRPSNCGPSSERIYASGIRRHAEHYGVCGKVAEPLVARQHRNHDRADERQSSVERAHHISNDCRAPTNGTAVSGSDTQTEEVFADGGADYCFHGDEVGERQR